MATTQTKQYVSSKNPHLNEAFAKPWYTPGQHVSVFRLNGLLQLVRVCTKCRKFTVIGDELTLPDFIVPDNTPCPGPVTS